MAYLARRTAEAAITLFVTSIVVFLLIRSFPGDPALIYAGPDASPETLAAIRRSFGLDLPLPVQYVSWAANVLRGDLGRSYYNGVPTMSLIADALPATLELTVAASIFALALGLSTGIVAALKRGTWSETAIGAFNAVAMAIPAFWLGILLVLIFVVKWPVIPLGSRVSVLTDPVLGLRGLVLPAIALGLGLGAIVSRFTQNAMLEALGSDHVRTAIAKGLPRRTVYWRHALRSALIPLVTVLGLQLAGLLGGAVFVEWVFGWPGMGSLAVRSLVNRDYAVLQAVLLYLVTAYVLVNFLVDVLYVLLDPRVRLSSR